MRLFVVSMMVAGMAPASAVAQAPSGAGAPDPAPATQIIVRFAAGTDSRERGEARSDADVRREAVLPLARTELVDPDPGVAVTEAIRLLEREPDVLYAEPNASRAAYAAPDDRFYRLQWGLENTGQRPFDPRSPLTGVVGADIDASAAWDVTTGSRDVVVGVVDSGAAIPHPDLAGNLWRNPGESGEAQADNGFDDDGNGFADDVNGYDFADSDAQPLDGDGHGTHVAGTIGAEGGNAIGVTGVAQSSSLMVLRALDDNGRGDVADTLAAYAYAARNGARVVNLSFGGAFPSRAERDALSAAGDVLFVAAAGNGGADNDAGGSFPCSYDLPNVICVAATDRADGLAGFSNRGRRTVDLGAPGVEIGSTSFDADGDGDYANEYVSMTGTSMAAPHVAGVAALALSRAPGLTVAQLRGVLLGSVEATPALRATTVTGGRLNAAGAVQAADTAGPAPSPPPPGPPQEDPAPDPAVVSGWSPVGAMPATPASAGPGAPVTPAGPRPGVGGDRTAPGLVVRSGASRRVVKLRRRGVGVSVRCSEACRLTLTLTLDAATARKLGLRRQIAVSRATVLRSGRRVVVLRLSAAARARLRGRGRAVIRVTAADAAGNRRTRTQAITLRP